MPKCALSGLHTFCSKVGELGRRVRSWPFDTLIGAFCPTFRALSDAPISVANGHDLTLIPSSPILEQKVCSPESAQVGKHNTQCRVSRLDGSALLFAYFHFFAHPQQRSVSRAFDRKWALLSSGACSARITESFAVKKQRKRTESGRDTSMYESLKKVKNTKR